MQIKSNSVSHIFVKKILEKWTLIVQKDDISKIWLKSGGSLSRISYAISLLKNEKKIIKISRDIYILNPTTDDISEFYWDIVEKIISIYSDSGAIITGDKSLELIMMNNFPPEKLFLCTRDFSARILLSDGREIYMRPLRTWEKTNFKNIFPILKKYCKNFGNYKKIFLPNKEIALLEALSLNSRETWIHESVILQFLSRNHKKLDYNILHEVANFGYIRPINRLRQIAKYNWYDELYQLTLDIIKSEWWWIFLKL